MSELATAKSQVTVPLRALLPVPTPEPAIVKAEALFSPASRSTEAFGLADLNAAVTAEVSVTSRSAKVIEPEVASVVAEESSARVSETSTAVMDGWSLVPLMVTTTSFVEDTPALSVAVIV